MVHVNFLYCPGLVLASRLSSGTFLWGFRFLFALLPGDYDQDIARHGNSIATSCNMGPLRKKLKFEEAMLGGPPPASRGNDHKRTTKRVCHRLSRRQPKSPHDL